LPDRYHIAVFAEFWNGFHRALLRGIGRYAQRRGDWSITMPAMAPGVPLDLADWRVDGAILATRRSDLPPGVPSVSLGDPAEGTASIVPDWDRVGRLAAEHLAELGLQRFAFFGDERSYSETRWTAFRNAVEAMGFAVERGDAPDPRTTWAARLETIGDWLTGLASPVGVFAVNDEFARLVLEAARFAGLGAPDQVAVLGAHNIPEICAMTSPGLSSVDTDGARIGRLAAELLADLLDGNAGAGPRRRVVEPRGVIERGSTGVVAIGDAVVADALRYIREHACDPVGPEEVAGAVNMSRRGLELRFRRSIRWSPSKLILRHQLRRARQLLAETDMPMSRVAEACGFRDGVRFSKVFAREAGQTPTAYRRTMRRRD